MKIFIDAYLSKNFGDDIMVQMLIFALKEHDLYINCDDDVLMPKLNIKKDIKKLKLNGNWYDKFIKIKDFDAYIVVGGSMFIINSKGSLLFRLLNLPFYIALKLSKIKIIITGCNVGPFCNSSAEKICKWELKNASLVTVRDKYSFKFLMDKKIKNLLYFPDIILSYPKEALPPKDNENNCLGITAYRSTTRPNDNYKNYQKMAEIADEYIERTNGKVIIFAFCAENENDIAAAYCIYNMSRHKDCIEIIVHNGDADAISNGFSNCKYIIAIRFHAVILSMLMNIPFIPVVYSKKTDDMLKDSGFCGYKIKIEELYEHDTNKIINFIINDEYKFVDYSDIIEKSSGHLKAVSAFLNNDLNFL